MTRRYHLELQGNPFLEMEYQFVSTAAFQVPLTLENDLSLLIYGFIFHHPGKFPDFCESLPERVRRRLPAELYYAGWSKITFRGVQSGEIEVMPYIPKFPPGDQVLMGSSVESPMRLRREWPSISDSAGVEYVLECSLEQPFGAMRLVIRAVGSVTLSVDLEEFVIAEDAYDHPEFGYDETRSRQLRDTP